MCNCSVIQRLGTLLPRLSHAASAIFHAADFGSAAALHNDATRIFQRRVKFQVNVDNVTDEFYADKSLGYANLHPWWLPATNTFRSQP